MNFLLDTHVYIWFESEIHKLSPRVLAICQDKSHTLYLSAASVWEMQIKIQAGKLVIPHLQDKIANQLQLEQIQLLPIELAHIYTLNRLPVTEHRDPFDRLLVAQALYQGWPLLSHDAVIAQYSITAIW